jgi:hypothetical protein
MMPCADRLDARARVRGLRQLLSPLCLPTACASARARASDWESRAIPLSFASPTSIDACVCVRAGHHACYYGLSSQTAKFMLGVVY